jgi:hypothetical protein
MDEMGPVTRADVQERAREIALINGRDGSNPSDEDRLQAEEELLNRHLNLSTDDSTDEPMAAASGSRLAADTGHKTKDHKPTDPQLLQEMEVREGLREAEHDSMVTERMNPERNE